MRQLVLLAVVSVLLAGAVVYSRQGEPIPAPVAVSARVKTDLQIAQEAKNPWTHLKLNNTADQFQFAVVTDRTGGHRAKIFSRAMDQLNLLQPEFVLSVGDLIEGYTTKMDVVQNEWSEFQSYVAKLQMPFFYVPGNHDLTNKEMVEEWGGRFGRRYYHFLYKDVLFLAVNSEDPVSKISPEQVEYFQKALAENAKARWTLVFLHKPLWTAKDLEANGWAGMEKALAGRNYTVFCGHVHRYQKFVRNGMNYYQLATTGGGSRLRGLTYGEFDHVSWITMKPTGPLIANILLDGVLPEDLQLPDSDEQGVPVKRKPTINVEVKVMLDGQPAAKATVRFYQKVTMPKERIVYVADGYSDDQGLLKLSTYGKFDGIPEGDYIVTATSVGVYDDGEAERKNNFPTKYATPETSPLRVSIKPEQKAVVELDLSSK